MICWMGTAVCVVPPALLTSTMFGPRFVVGAVAPVTLIACMSDSDVGVWFRLEL